MAQASSGGYPSALWRKPPTDARCCSVASGTVCFPCSQSGMTPARSMADRGVDSWTLLLLASRANRSASLAPDSMKPTSATSGLIRLESLAKYDQTSRSWKTSQGSLWTDTSDEFLATWPRSGTMRDGNLYQPVSWARHICDTACSSLPTPAAVDGKGTGIVSASLGRERGDKNNLRDYFGIRYGLVYPPVAVVEWLMGWPSGATDLAPLATDKYQQWSRTHGASCMDSQ